MMNPHFMKLTEIDTPFIYHNFDKLDYDLREMRKKNTQFMIVGMIIKYPSSNKLDQNLIINYKIKW